MDWRFCVDIFDSPVLIQTGTYLCPLSDLDDKQCTKLSMPLLMLVPTCRSTRGWLLLSQDMFLYKLEPILQGTNLLVLHIPIISTSLLLTLLLKARSIPCAATSSYSPSYRFHSLLSNALSEISTQE